MKLSEYEIQQVLQAAEILTSNLRVYITIPELLKKVRLTERKLIEGFHQEFGTTVYSYYTEARMKKAREMILEGIPVRHIARAIGYKGENAKGNFIKAFKKKFNVTPAVWGRKQLKKPNSTLHA
jgi:transcriptional regulator GlxA family with amidase domain